MDAQSDVDRRYKALFEKLAADKLLGTHGEPPAEQGSPGYVMPLVASYLMMRSVERQETVVSQQARLLDAVLSESKRMTLLWGVR